jgi:hypothetical protein
MQMPAADLAFTGFDDDSVDVLLQQLFETSGFLASGIVGIFQQNTIAFSREDIIKPLMDELTAARNELAKLRGLLAIKEEKLAKLGAAEVSAPANKSSPSASPAPIPRATTAKQQDMKYREIAQALDISEKTVENQMTKAIRLLRQYVKEKPYLWLCIGWICSMIANITWK